MTKGADIKSLSGASMRIRSIDGARNKGTKYPFRVELMKGQARDPTQLFMNKGPNSILPGTDEIPFRQYAKNITHNRRGYTQTFEKMSIEIAFWYRILKNNLAFCNPDVLPFQIGGVAGEGNFID